jgi:hypothetical protein
MKLDLHITTKLHHLLRPAGSSPDCCKHLSIHGVTSVASEEKNTLISVAIPESNTRSRVLVILLCALLVTTASVDAAVRAPVQLLKALGVATTAAFTAKKMTDEIVEDIQTREQLVALQAEKEQLLGSIQTEYSNYDRLRELNTSRASVLTIQYELDNAQASVYWADIFSKPDPFVTVAIADLGEYVGPHVITDYQSGLIIENIVIPEAIGSRDLVVSIYDSDSASDRIWNNLLQTAVTFTVSANKVLYARRVDWTASGRIQLIQDGQHIDLDSPDGIAVFKISNNGAGDTWKMQWCFLYDAAGTSVGRIKCSCDLQLTPEKKTRLEAHMADVQLRINAIATRIAQIDKQTQQSQRHLGSAVVWGVLLLCAIVIFIKLVFFKSTRQVN